MTEYEVDFVGYEAVYGVTDPIVADTEEEARELASSYTDEFYPELIDVEFKEVRKFK